MSGLGKKYKVWKRPPEQVLRDIRGHFQKNRAFEAALICEEYFQRLEIEKEIKLALGELSVEVIEIVDPTGAATNDDGDAGGGE